MKRFVVYVLLVLAFAHLTLNYSLFGLGDRADKYIQDLVNTYAGNWLYPEPRDDVTVLLLTDETIDNYQEGRWPASYDFHGQVLNTVRKHQPAAVFIDFLLLSQRAQAAGDSQRDEYLIKVLRRYQDDNIPVYLAYSPAVQKHWPELDDLVTYVQPQFELDYVDFVSRTYPVTRGDLMTPAFQIAQDIRPELFSRPLTESMDVFWGTLPNEKNSSWMTNISKETPLHTVLVSGCPGGETAIPFNTTLFARDLMNPVIDPEDDDPETANGYITDKVILYGANLAGVNDFIFTPTRNILPGVYLHAMALDNLLHWGADYKSVNGSGLIAKNGLREMWSLLIVLPVAMLFALFQRRVHIKPSVPVLYSLQKNGWRFANKFPRLSKVAVMLVLAAWFIAWAGIEFFWFNVSAASVAGYVEFLLIGFFVEKYGWMDWVIDKIVTPVQKLMSAFRPRRITS